MNFQMKMNTCSILSNVGWTKRGNAPLFSSKCTMPSSTARWRTQRAEFSLYTTASKKSIGKLHKKSCLGSPEIVQLFSKKFLTSGAGGGILFTEVKGKRFLKRRKATVKKLPKNFKKPLDKPSEKCYNESTRKPNEP